MNSHRIFVEKTGSHAIEATQLRSELKQIVQVQGLEEVRYATIYDVIGISYQDLQSVIPKVFAEAPRSRVFHSLDSLIDISNEEQQASTKNISHQYAAYCAMEYLPGQYDQQADATEQCLKLLGFHTAQVNTGKILLLYGEIATTGIEQVAQYCINPIEMQVKNLNISPAPKEFSKTQYTDTTINEFCQLSKAELNKTKEQLGLSMSEEDMLCIQEYFILQNRNPTLTEIKILDTYWSDHCRHTTFLTEITNISVSKEINTKYQSMYERSLSLYYSLRKSLNIQKPVCLMDLATIGAKYLITTGKVNNVDISEEVNACSIVIPVKFEDNSIENWLLMFKNETHNHPTEIEPFGGAATCLGGAIRDPLSGRAYVFAGMRISGSANPFEPIQNTIANKLPQRYITQQAAHGFSSYGNQMGLPTLFVREIYHEGYKAKRLEAGFVLGAVPQSIVQRNTPQDGDKVLLIGGKTGRDGIGGAVGSSKKHTTQSLSDCFAEVQKGNPLEAHALQRLFRNPEFITLIKRCNDFGAGGVSVAVGELADGIDINLDSLLVKYLGLDGTELAISESQERMAIVCAKEHVAKIRSLAKQENIDAVEIATITQSPHMKMQWQGTTIVDIHRDFISSNGASRKSQAILATPHAKLHNTNSNQTDVYNDVLQAIASLNIASQHNLQSQFDSTIGAGTVLMPYGGITQTSPAEGIAASIPTDKATNTVALASSSCPINWLDFSPYHGAGYAVVNSIAKLVAMGGDYTQARLSFQEYFPRTESPEEWGLPVAALLGALEAQVFLETPAIGGKDSMSGNFEELKVPPTFISFAVSSTDFEHVLPTELSLRTDNSPQYIYIIPHIPMEDGTPNYNLLKSNWTCFTSLVQTKKQVLNAVSIDEQGLFLGLLKMCIGNNIGVNCTIHQEWLYADFLHHDITQSINTTLQGSILFATATQLPPNAPYICIGSSNYESQITITLSPDSPQQQQDSSSYSWSLETLRKTWLHVFDTIFPLSYEHKDSSDAHNTDALNIQTTNNSITSSCLSKKIVSNRIYPQICIPIFPGTNCERDTVGAFQRFGATCLQPIFRNKSFQDITNSINLLSQSINQSQILVIAGGFSLGDQPDGAGKYIANILRFQIIADAIHNLLARDGLLLGICNGFQALIKSGWLPYSSPHEQTSEDPTLTQNSIGLHISTLCKVKIGNNFSPWLTHYKVGDTLQIPFSHGEGRLAISSQLLPQLINNKQIATTYLNKQENPNGSINHIEGITSIDGKILGRMGHSERITPFTFKNIPSSTSCSLTDNLNMFKSGVEYFL